MCSGCSFNSISAALSDDLDFDLEGDLSFDNSASRALSSVCASSSSRAFSLPKVFENLLGLPELS